MKVKLNYFFFLFVFVAPLIGALVALPYGLFIASTPYYFSWPFGSFWQEFFILTIIIIFLVSVFAFYIALPWLAVIKEDRVVFHRLFRKKLEINLAYVKEIEMISKKLPVRENPWGVGSIIFRKDERNYILVAGVSNSTLHLIGEMAKKKGIYVYETNRQLTQEEKHKID